MMGNKEKYAAVISSEYTPGASKAKTVTLHNMEELKAFVEGWPKDKEFIMKIELDVKGE